MADEWRNPIERMGEKNPVFIYSLCDPRDMQVRYIGKTIDPQKRLARHLCDRDNNHRTHWIISLLRAGFLPFMTILEKVNSHNWIEREQYWINKFRSEGFSLVNGTDGGDGRVGPGKPLSEEHRQKLSVALKGRRPSQAAIDALTWRNRNVLVSETTRRKMSNTRKGRKATEETRRKMSEAQKGKTIPQEQREKIRAALMGHPVLQGAREKMRAAKMGRNKKVSANG